MSKSQIVFAGLAPHAPVLIPGVAGERLGEVKRTVASMHTFASRLVSEKPDTVVVISPHSPRHAGAFGLWRRTHLRGDFKRFAPCSESIDLPNDETFAKALEDMMAEEGLHTWNIREDQLDYGASVPLWYLWEAGWRGPTIVLSLSEPSTEGLDALGDALEETAESLGKRTAVVASGDMSHRLTPSAPCGFDPAGPEFDEAFTDIIRQGDYTKFNSLDEDLRELAAEDSLEPTLIAIKAVGGGSEGHQVLSYEGPFGVGYCVAVLFSGAAQTAARSKAMTRAWTTSEPVEWNEQLPAVARMALEMHLAGENDIPDLKVKGDVDCRACVFVTLYDSEGGLRGCIGTLMPCEENLAMETWRSALEAAFSDPRFPPVSSDELSTLSVTVTVLGELEDVDSPESLDPKVYGVVVRSKDGRRGVLLPDIEGIDTVERQLEIVRHKANIGPDEPIELQRFRARCYNEEEEL